VPILLPLIKKNGIAKMEQRSVVGPKILMHDSFVDNNLFLLLAIGPVVVELEGLNKLVLVVGIPLISFDNPP
jgi:hypothetical protein